MQGRYSIFRSLPQGLPTGRPVSCVDLRPTRERTRRMTQHLADHPLYRTERLISARAVPGDFEGARALHHLRRARFVGGGADRTSGWPGASSQFFYGPLAPARLRPLRRRTPGRGAARRLRRPWFPGDWPEPELGWTIWTKGDEGRGYAREAVEAVRRHAYGDLGAGPPPSATYDPRNEPLPRAGRAAGLRAWTRGRPPPRPRPRARGLAPPRPGGGCVCRHDRPALLPQPPACGL